LNLNLNLKKSDLDLRKLQWVHQTALPATLYVVIFGGAWKLDRRRV